MRSTTRGEAMTKLEEAVATLMNIVENGTDVLVRTKAKALADELDRLRAKVEDLGADLRSARIALREHDTDSQKLIDWAEISRKQSAEADALRAQLEASREDVRRLLAALEQHGIAP